MAPELKLGQDLRLRQQLVMTPQLQQAIKILQLSLPELEAVVQTELESNPLLEMVEERSPTATAADDGMAAAPDPTPGSEPDLLPPEPELGAAAAESEWNGNGDEQPTVEGMTSEARDATTRDQGGRPPRQTRLARVPRKLLQQLAGQPGVRTGRRTPPDPGEHAHPPHLARRAPDVAAPDVRAGAQRSDHRRDHHLQP